MNGVSPPVGADQYVLKPGDKVLWYWALFGLAGRAEDARARSARSRKAATACTAVDDTGARTAALGAVLHVDGHAVKTQGATQAAVGCVGTHHGLVRATLRGAVRSNALP